MDNEDALYNFNLNSKFETKDWQKYIDKVTDDTEKSNNFVAYILSMEYLNKVPQEMVEKFIDLVKVMAKNQLLLEFCSSHCSKLIEMIPIVFTEGKYHVTFLITEILVLLQNEAKEQSIHVHYNEMSLTNTVQYICQYTAAIEYPDHNVFSILCNILEVSGESQISNNILSIYIENLPSKTWLTTISNVTCFLSCDKVLVEFMTRNNVFWEKLMDCLESTDSSLRKRSLFFLNYIINSQMVDSSNQNDDLTDLLVVLETLEETQSHIVRPVLAKIPKLYESVTKGKLAIRWITIVFNRILDKESRMISRWGMQLILQLPPIAFHSENGISALETILHAHLNSTYMYYMPNFISKGNSPPVVLLLGTYLQRVCTEFDHCLSKKFLQNLCLFLGQTKTGSTPLTYLTHILSKLQLPYKLCGSFLQNIADICRITLPTQPNKVKGVVQGFLLSFICKNIDCSDPKLLDCLENFFDCMIIEYILDGEHYLWEKLSSLIELNVCNDNEVLGCYILKKLEVQKNEFTKTIGFSLVLAMIDRKGLLDGHILDRVLYPIKNCGTNIYISKSSVICIASTIELIFQFYHKNPKQSTIITSCIQCIDNILDNCSWFLPNYCNEVLASDSFCFEMQHLEHLSGFLINLTYHDGGFKSEKLFTHIIKENLLFILNFKQLSPQCLQLQSPKEFSLLISSYAVLFSALMERNHKPLELVRFFDKIESLDWLVPFLQSSILSTLENSWTCFCFFVQYMNVPSNLEKVAIFNLAVESIQKMKCTQTILILFDLIRHLTPAILTENASLFSESIPSMLTILSDFLDSGVYWRLLSSFCCIIFNSDVMNNPLCCETLIKVINDFKDLTSSKESVMSYVANSLMSYGESDMSNAQWFIDTILELSLFGVTRTREKQNTDDLMAYIDNLDGADSLYCYINELTADVSFVRVQMINLLHRILEKFPEFSSSVVGFYINSFKCIQKAALQNSLPNRTKVRISQALLCLLPILLKDISLSSVTELLEQIVSLLSLDSQPSVRCFVESCISVILSHYPDLISLIFIKISSPGNQSNVFLAAIFSIITHHITYLHLKSVLDQKLLDNTMKNLSVWTCANNHNVRSVSCACLVMLADVYSKCGWDIPQHYDMQVKFIVLSKDYKKLLTNTVQKNVYFSRFNIYNDLCLLNIFHSIPLQFHILENECVCRMKLDELKYYLSYPVVSGDFHLLSRPPSLEQCDYLIKFDDLSEALVLQKKITPWQVMATNLGIEFDKKSTQKGELIIFASLIDKGNNLGGLARTAEIFGVQTITLNNMEILNNRDFKSLSMTAEKWLNFEEIPYNTDSTVAYFKSKKRDGYTIVGVEQASNSVSLEQFQFPLKSLLVLGREKDGIPVELLSHLDVCVEIPQLGLVRSLNVHVSASIIIWEYSKQHLISKNT